MLTIDMLDRRWSHAPHSLLDAMAASAPSVFAKYGIATPAEAADLMAQMSEETGGGTMVEENLNYSAARLCRVWPSRFPSLAAALPYAHNPRGLADRVYNGRYGNRPGTGDGWNFRGRGGIQITFRAEYEALAKTTGLDLADHPELASSPPHFLEVACAYWKAHGINAFADAGDFRGETIRINGGTTNYATRLAWRSVWRKELQA